jgi:putative acyl-CoA dehydrogenase
MLSAAATARLRSLSPIFKSTAWAARPFDTASRGHSTTGPSPHAASHVVENQATPLGDVNLYSDDALLRNAVAAFGGAWAEDVLVACGAAYGAEATAQLAVQANRHRPELRTHDRFGHRIDAVNFHPAYHSLMAMGKELQLPSFAWNPQHVKLPASLASGTAAAAAAPTRSTKLTQAAAPAAPVSPGLHTARAALPFIGNQVESGTQCPLTMTYAAVAALRHCEVLEAEWVPGLVRPAYDARDVPAPEKAGLTLGMSMTEKQGGSDVRSNTTVARSLDPARRGRSGETYVLTGHKWFTSAPMCDAFLTLAYTEDCDRATSGPSCFLVPRWLPDGSRNAGFQLQRLKDKLGDHSNASSEVEYHGAHGRLLGQEGRGVKCIIEMVSLTRLDCTLGSAGLVRHALSQALQHTSGRKAFGARLLQQPLMRNVLVDLALEAEALMLLTFRSARGIDDAAAGSSGSSGSGGGRSGALSRLLTAVAKYYVCRSAPLFVFEAMECHGGNGFVEVC